MAKTPRKNRDELFREWETRYTIMGSATEHALKVMVGMAAIGGVIVGIAFSEFVTSIQKSVILGLDCFFAILWAFFLEVVSVSLMTKVKRIEHLEKELGIDGFSFMDAGIKIRNLFRLTIWSAVVILGYLAVFSSVLP